MLSDYFQMVKSATEHRAVTRALIGGGGGEYLYFCVLPDEFLLKSVVIKVDFKRNSSGRTRIYEYSPPPPPINALVTAQLTEHADYDKG